MKLIELVHHQHTTNPLHDLFFADGKRISKEKYSELSDAATRTDTFLTKRTASGHKHYKTIYLP